MSSAGLLLFLGFSAAVMLIMILPLLTTSKTNRDVQDAFLELSLKEQLQAQHEAILITVRDLDFDYQTGKLTEDDYLVQRELQMQQGVETLAQLQTLQPQAKGK